MQKKYSGRAGDEVRNRSVCLYCRTTLSLLWRVHVVGHGLSFSYSVRQLRPGVEYTIRVGAVAIGNEVVIARAPPVQVLIEGAILMFSTGKKSEFPVRKGTV